MYMIYSCELAQWSRPPTMRGTLHWGNNPFTSTLSLLVSAVQKLRTVTVIPDGLTPTGGGGLVTLPEHFTQPDEHNCGGMTKWGWGFSADKSVALQYSGVVQGRPYIDAQFKKLEAVLARHFCTRRWGLQPRCGLPQ